MIDCIIQARKGSSRLPEKTLMELENKKTTLDFVIEQLSFSKLINRVVIATTSLDKDNVIEQKARTLGINCFRGSETDVLDRYYRCAKEFEMKTIVRITADCPIIDPIIVDKVIEQFQSGDYDYAANIIFRTYPVGTDTEIFSFNSLERCWNEAKQPSEREHVTPFIRNKKMDFNVGNIEYDKDLSKIRVTLDRKEDYELIKLIVKECKKRPILLQDIIKLFGYNNHCWS